MMEVIPPGQEPPSNVAAHNRLVFARQRWLSGIPAALFAAYAIWRWPDVIVSAAVGMAAFACASVCLQADYRHWICDTGGGGIGRYLWARLVGWWW